MQSMLDCSNYVDFLLRMKSGKDALHTLTGSFQKERNRRCIIRYLASPRRDGST